MSIPPTLQSLMSGVAALPDGAVEETVVAHGEVTLVTSRERLIELLTGLRDRLGFEMLTDETCVDYFPREPRFGLVYHLNSLSRQMRVRVKILLGEYERTAPSASGVYASANWLEREIYDLFGIRFDGHPDLRRIMMPPGWEGHPLLKENPVKVEEVAFSFNRERIDRAKPHARE